MKFPLSVFIISGTYLQSDGILSFHTGKGQGNYC